LKVLAVTPEVVVCAGKQFQSDGAGHPVFEAMHAAVPFEALAGVATGRVEAGSSAPIAHASHFEYAVLPADGRLSAARLRHLLAHMLALTVLRYPGDGVTLPAPTSACFPGGDEHGP
jgi:hypothetical protein